MTMELSCDARSEREVYQFVNAYVEAGGCAGTLGFLPLGTATVITSINDVRQRYVALIG
jgi:hypothetical protein